MELIPVILVLGRLRQENPKFEVSLGYTACTRLAWVHGDTLSQQTRKKIKRGGAKEKKKGGESSKQKWNGRGRNKMKQKAQITYRSTRSNSKQNKEQKIVNLTVRFFSG